MSSSDADLDDFLEGEEEQQQQPAPLRSPPRPAAAAAASPAHSQPGAAHPSHHSHTHDYRSGDAESPHEEGLVSLLPRRDGGRLHLAQRSASSTSASSPPPPTPAAAAASRPHSPSHAADPLEAEGEDPTAPPPPPAAAATSSSSAPSLSQLYPTLLEDFLAPSRPDTFRTSDFVQQQAKRQREQRQEEEGEEGGQSKRQKAAAPPAPFSPSQPDAASAAMSRFLEADEELNEEEWAQIAAAESEARREGQQRGEGAQAHTQQQQLPLSSPPPAAASLRPTGLARSGLTSFARQSPVLRGPPLAWQQAAPKEGEQEAQALPAPPAAPQPSAAAAHPAAAVNPPIPTALPPPPPTRSTPPSPAASQRSRVARPTLPAALPSALAAPRPVQPAFHQTMNSPSAAHTAAHRPHLHTPAPKVETSLTPFPSSRPYTPYRLGDVKPSARSSGYVVRVQGLGESWRPFPGPIGRLRTKLKTEEGRGGETPVHFQRGTPSRSNIRPITFDLTGEGGELECGLPPPSLHTKIEGEEDDEDDSHSDDGTGLSDPDFHSPNWLEMLSVLGLPMPAPQEVEWERMHTYPLDSKVRTPLQQKPLLGAGSPWGFNLHFLSAPTVIWRNKIPLLLCVVSAGSVSLSSGSGDARVRLKDPFGELTACLSRDVIQKYPELLSPHTAVALTNVTLFHASPQVDGRTLIVTHRNVEKDSVWKQQDGAEQRHMHVHDEQPPAQAPFTA